MTNTEYKTIAQVARERLEAVDQQPIVLGDHVLKRDRLDSISRAIAGMSADPCAPVGLLMDLAPDGGLMLTAALASGRPVVPLDVTGDRELLLARLRSVGSCPLVVSPGCEGVIATLGDVDVLDMTRPGGTADLLDPGPADPAAVCFTSGTTGLPMPYARSQQGLLEVGFHRSVRRGLSPGHRALFCLSPLFVGMMNTFAQTLVGRGVSVFHQIKRGGVQDLVDVIHDFRVNYFSIVPSLLRRLIESAGRRGLPDSLQAINISGELMMWSDVRRWSASLPATTQMHVSYGSTESGTVTIGFINPTDRPDDEPVTLGAALPNVELVVTDASMKPLPPGRRGSIYVRSRAVADSFVDAVVKPVPSFAIEGRGSGFYAMGDEGSLLENGELVVFGRADREIKIDGVRFNPAACEGGLRSVSGVNDAAVIIVDTEGEPQPVAFVAADDSRYDEVRRSLRSSGPAGQRVRVEFLDALPTTQTGKTCRRTLEARARELLEGGGASVHEGMGGAEYLIADLWSERLGIPRPPTDRSFFEFGGDSLGLLSLVIELKERFGVVLPLDRLHELDTIKRQASVALVEHDAPATTDPFVPLRPAPGSSSVLFVLPGVGGHAWSFAPLAEAVGGESEIIGVNWAKQPDLEALAGEMIARAGARSCAIGGFSAGGRVAAVLARRMELRKVRLRRLVILDSQPIGGLRMRMKLWWRWMKLRRAQGNELERHLSALKSSGYSILMKLKPVDLETPVRLVVSRQTSASLVQAWSAHARISMTRVPCSHLELVSVPVHEVVSRSLRSAFDEEPD